MMYDKPSAFCHHYLRRERLAPTTQHFDISMESNGMAGANTERRRKMTFAWAVEQKFMRNESGGMTTEEWVKQQREYQTEREWPQARKQYASSRKPAAKAAFVGETRQMRSQEKVYMVETLDSAEDETAWEKAERQAKARIREEFRKMEDHLRRKQDEERSKQKQRISAAWNRYEQGWNRMNSEPTDEKLCFDSIPWPVIVKATDSRDLTKKAVSKLFLGLSGAAVLAYNLFPNHPLHLDSPSTAPSTSQPKIVKANSAPTPTSNSENPVFIPDPAPVPESSDDKALQQDESSSSTPESESEGQSESSPAANKGAYDPVTGEINWDCPCLGGMAHGPCGEEFKEAFSCFVYSEAEPKGINCVEKFQAMQNCFRAHPDVYADEIMRDDDDETPEASASSNDSQNPQPTDDTLSDPTSEPQRPSQDPIAPSSESASVTSS
ncbi:hypothetical protein CVT24_005139 [Panaeolus cyanescens]|uniref:Mitochondrial intermembrane space import and assembly protein 40 n=1 Tax=Panaeolus cyanescens TaxID=181874 RepID=A0A409V9Q8_9AGAR|nr:hypothetical protein CVT24_005139 [Panaeolus cyanescens]